MTEPTEATEPSSAGLLNASHPAVVHLMEKKREYRAAFAASIDAHSAATAAYDRLSAANDLVSKLIETALSLPDEQSKAGVSDA